MPIVYLYRGAVDAARLTEGHKRHVCYQEACGIDVICHTCAVTASTENRSFAATA